MILIYHTKSHFGQSAYHREPEIGAYSGPSSLSPVLFVGAGRLMSPDSRYAILLRLLIVHYSTQPFVQGES